jgi:quinol monooxygenase YgiN
MILVLGKVEVQSGSIDEALAMSQEHVLRSRAEPGCLEHGVHRSHDHPETLVFVERWRDLEALQAHFRVAESRQFAKALSTLAAAPPSIEIYSASRLPLPGTSAA